MTNGINDEVSSVGLTLANGAITSGMTVGIFLTSAANFLKTLGAGTHLLGAKEKQM